MKSNQIAEIFERLPAIEVLGIPVVVLSELEKVLADEIAGRGMKSHADRRRDYQAQLVDQIESRLRRMEADIPAIREWLKRLDPRGDQTIDPPFIGPGKPF